MKCVVVVVVLAALAVSVTAQGNSPGQPNFNGPSLASAMSQSSPVVGDASDDVDFLGTPCSTDVHFGTGVEYYCFCGESISQTDLFFCDGGFLDAGDAIGIAGDSAPQIGGADNAGQVSGGVRAEFMEDCKVKDVNVRVKLTGANNSEIQVIFQVKDNTGDSSAVDGVGVRALASGSNAVVKLMSGQVKIADDGITDTCSDYRLGAWESGGDSAQNQVITDVDAAYDDKIGLVCNDLPEFGGDGACDTSGMTLYADALAASTGFPNGIDSYCPLNAGQLIDDYIHTDLFQDRSGEVSSADELLADGTVVGGVHTIQGADEGTGDGLNLFDGMIMLGGTQYDACWETILDGTQYPGSVASSPWGFFITVVDDRESSLGGVPTYFNQWCVDFLCEQIAPTPTPSPTMIIARDPHFTGFHGEKFDVMAEPGEVFNILSDSDTQLNALFVAGARGEHQTFVGEYGVKFGEHRVRVAASGQVFVDDVPLAHNNKERKYALTETGDAYVTTNTKRNGNVDVSVVLPSYTFKFAVITQRNVHKDGTAHVNMRMSVRNGDARPHGLLGQTVLPPSARSAHRAHNDMKQGGDAIEGSYVQYKIADNSLFGDEFKYNRFGKRAKRDAGDDFDASNLTAFSG